MTEHAFSNVAIVGAGTMGHGIAQVCAMAGMEVRMYDVADAALQRGLDAVHANLDKGVDRGKVSEELRDAALMRLAGSTDLETTVDAADLIIEAVPEVLSLKQALFAEIEPMVEDTAVFGTNTSSLSVAAIAGVLHRPERLIGLHFFNPVHIMKLLEVISHPTTADAVVDRVRAFGAEIAKECI